ncbi:MAG TPA: DUF3391 domain-containing protein, partial [Nitrospiraceae bacterium]
MRKRILLPQLRVGMYVAGIGCSWFRTPFLKHRFLVHTVEQIERLQRSNIHAVDIDPSKGLDVTSFPIADETLNTIGLHTSIQSPPAHDAPRSLDTLNQELAIAQETRDKLAQSVKTVFDEISKEPRPSGRGFLEEVQLFSPSLLRLMKPNVLLDHIGCHFVTH